MRRFRQLVHAHVHPRLPLSLATDDAREADAVVRNGVVGVPCAMKGVFLNNGAVLNFPFICL